MKRIIAAILCVCCVAAIAAGCGYTDALSSQTPSSQSEPDEESTADEAKEVKRSDYSDTFKGLCGYFTAKEYVPKEDDKNKPVEMDASLIGAKEGKKYTTAYNGKTVVIELYVFDAANLNDTAKEIVNSVKTDGTFSILPDKKGEKLPAVTAYLSDSEKFLMIYTDESIDKEKPDKESEAYIHREEVIKDFKTF